jgi:hypothetical protein
MEEPPEPREELGFRRTVCACAFCQVHCRHIPGTLLPSDLARLCPPGQDLLTWAEQHLRALTDKGYPALVPARGPGGACHWFFQGLCAVHADAPFGCAYFDSHMDREEIDRRASAMAESIRQDVAAGGVYGRVWLHLRNKGLLAAGGDREKVWAEMRKVRHRLERGGRCGEGG